MYLQNKYTLWYYKIIENSKNRELNIYSEKHHIIPRSLGGSDDKENIAVLTGREHFLCHLLLVRMTTGKNKFKMLRAIEYMSKIPKKIKIYKIHARHFQYIRSEIAKTPVPDSVRKKIGAANKKLYADPEYRKKKSEQIRAFYNTPEGEIVKQKLREANTGRRPSEETRAKMRNRIITDEYRKKQSEKSKGRIQSEETKRKRSESTKGRDNYWCRGKSSWNKGIPNTPEQNAKASAKLKGMKAWNKGIPASEESNLKRKAKQSNIPKPKIECPHCHKIGGQPAMIRHHFDKCKFNIIPT